jgi:hypothetical protein
MRFNPMNCKALLLPLANFNGLSENQIEQLFEHHNKNLIVIKSN